MDDADAADKFAGAAAISPWHTLAKNNRAYKTSSSQSAWNSQAQNWDNTIWM